MRAVVFAGLLIMPSLALAQGPSEDLTSLSIEELARVKVTSASRHSQDALVAPSAVTVITAEAIAQNGWRTLAEALASVRGLYIAYDRNYTYLGVRGFQRPGDYNDRILLLINGHRLNDNVYGSAFIGTEFPLDLDLIDRIEVVRGPSSSLYGTNAVFGVVNVITRKPGSSRTVEASGDTSSFLGRTGRLTMGGERNGVATLVSGSLYRSAGQSSLFYPEFAGPATNNGFANNIDGDSFAHGFADVTYGNFRLQVLLGSRKKIIPTASFNTNFNDPGTRTTDMRGYVDLSYHRSLSARTELEVRGYYDNYQYSGTYAYGGTGPPLRYLNHDGSRADSAGADVMLAWQIGRHRITAGAQYEYSFRVDQWNYDVGGATYLNDHRAPSQTAGYTQAELKLLSKLAVNAGARLDWFSAYGSSLDPRLAVIYTPAPRTALKYIFGRAFRAPNAYETYYADGISLTSNLNLKPEIIQSHEAVLEHNLKPWLQITAGGFYADMQRLIDQVFDPFTGLNHYVNSGSETSKGLEFEIAAKRKSGLSAQASYTLSDARDSATGARAANSPLHLAKLHVAVPATRRGSAGLELLYASAQESYQGPRVPGYVLTNITFLSKPLWNGWTFSASCYNLFDRRWWTPAGADLRQAAILQDGRSWRVKITYRLPERPRQQDKK